MLCTKSIPIIPIKGTRIQATALSRALPKFANTAVESRVYLIDTFSVSINKSPFRATTHPFKLEFSQHTKIEEVDGDLPFYSYSFYSLSDLLRIKEKKEVEHLIGIMDNCLFEC